ncbi:MAG: hypothetical protein Fur002_12870 [Anaerolineales bacterium]
MKTLYPLHSLIRRNLVFFERLLAALGLAALVYGMTRVLPVYPLHWDSALAGLVFALTLISPVLGYFAAVLAAAYPLLSVSLYLAVIFLAIAIIGQRLFIENLGATLLTLASPLLGSIYLAWSIPLLGGLWWGPVGGAFMGALGALWGMMVAGMAGVSPDWANLYGVLPVFTSLPEAFRSANSLETIGLLFLPIAPDSTALLYYLLQILTWAFIGWMAGMLSEKDWAQRFRPRLTMLIALIGAALLAGMQILLSAWLRMPISPTAELSLGFTTLFSALAVMALELTQDFLDHPLPMPAAKKRSLAVESQPVAPAALPTGDSVPQESLSTLQQSDKNDAPDDLIMLELD